MRTFSFEITVLTDLSQIKSGLFLLYGDGGWRKMRTLIKVGWGGRKPVTTSPLIVDISFSTLSMWGMSSPLRFHRAMSFCLGADGALCSGRWVACWHVWCTVCIVGKSKKKNNNKNQNKNITITLYNFKTAQISEIRSIKKQGDLDDAREFTAVWTYFRDNQVEKL